MIADNSEGAVVDVGFDFAHDPFGVRAVTDVVTEEYIASDVMGLGMQNTGFECLPVAMNIGHDCVEH